MKARLEGAEVVLVVSHSSPIAAPTVQVCASVDVALKSWTASTRCSPLYSLNGSVWPSLTGRNKVEICFLGPIYPALIPQGVQAFLSLGLYNVILVAATALEKKLLKTYLEKQVGTIPWEKWTLSKGVVNPNVEYSPFVLKKLISTEEAGPIKTLPPELGSVADEYRTLIAATKAKGGRYLPQVATEIAVFDSGFRTTLESDKWQAVAKSQWLVNVNAALSRFSSQTFAGISPILGSECHYWTHSLLGIGMAAQGLLAIRRQVHAASGRANFRKRIEALKSSPPNPSALEKLKLADGFWQRHHLPDEIGAVSDSSARLPLIVCFSGRDGFRSTTHTLSVPLEVISASNTVGWTLRTVTHELSHIFVDSILGTILPKLGSAASMNSLFTTFEKESPANLFEQLQAYTCYSLCLMCTTPDSEALDVKNGDDLKDAIQKSYPEASEILTHIFDFMYFYQRDPKTYISAIWGSWDVIPNIMDRIDEYLIRTLCSVLVLHLSVADPFGNSIKQVLEHLKELRVRFPEGVFVGEAIKRLEKNSAEIKERLHHVEHLVRLSYAFIYSPIVAALMNRTAPESRSKKSTGSKVFDANRVVDNPLKFIYEHSGTPSMTNSPDVQKSAWMMAQLAFSKLADDRKD